MPGAGTSNTSQQSQQSGTTAPWAPAQPELNSILGGIGGLNATPNDAQNAGVQGLLSGASAMPNYGAAASGGVSSLLGSLPQSMQQAYQTYQGQLSPIANQNNDPTKTPGMQGVLQTIQNDVGNSVNSQFAGAGRDLSGLNQQTLARGIAQGEAPALLNQYNQNVSNQTGAANNLFSGAGANATTQGNLYGAGISGAGALPGLYGANANALLNAGNTQAGLPAQNLGLLEGLTLPIAGLGSQTTGNVSSQGSATMSPIQQAMGLSGIFGQMFGGQGAGGGGWLSDRRLKTDIKQVGALYDGTPVYRFRYHGQDRMNIGLMADEVEKYAPDALGEVSGFKTVDYGRATDRAVELGAR